MSKKTTNYSLVKPELTDTADITAMNPNWDTIDNELKKRVILDESGKVPSSQLPRMDYIPTTEKNAANGVAGLGADGKIPVEQLPNVGGSGKRTARFTVGSRQYGWTSSDCDYLCDGSADDVEINAAIQALRSTGGEIVLLDGIYTLTGIIHVDKENVTLTGNGANTKIVRAFNDDEYESEQGLVVVKGSHCTIRNLHFDGARGTYASNTIIYVDCDNCIIENNTIVNSSCDGLYAYGNFHKIEGNTFRDCEGSGLYLYNSTKVVVTDNKIFTSNSYGMYLYRVSDSTVSGNVSMSNTDSGIKVYWADRTTFTGNTLNSNTQCGLYMTRGKGSVIVGNTCNGNNHYGIYLGTMTEKCVVMSNSMIDNTTSEIKDEGTDNKLDMKVDDIITQVSAVGLKIETGSYTGTAMATSKSLTFNGVPCLVYISVSSESCDVTEIGHSGFLIMMPNSSAYSIFSGSTISERRQWAVSVTVSGTTITWTTIPNNPASYNIMDVKNLVYNYTAICI